MPDYRYRLVREWDEPGTTLLVVALNPSTADDTVDDPTTQRLTNVARERGHGRYVLVNLYAARSTAPAGLLLTDDPVGPDNDAAIARAVRGADEVLLAWGVAGIRTPGFPDRVQQVMSLIGDLPTIAQGRTKDGHPRPPTSAAQRRADSGLGGGGVRVSASVCFGLQLEATSCG